jgi:uncharacterized RmlC-like cupin family protein
VKVVKPTSRARELPRGVIGGAEVSGTTAGSRGIYMGKFKVPPAAESRPHYHATAQSVLFMLSGRLEIRWGEDFGEGVTLEPEDMLYVPAQETHILRNVSDSEPVEYIVARDVAMDESVEVAWAG